MKRSELTDLMKKLPWKPSQGDSEHYSYDVVQGLRLLSSLGKRAEKQLRQLSNDGCLNQPVMWLEKRGPDLTNCSMHVSKFEPELHMTDEHLSIIKFKIAPTEAEVELSCLQTVNRISSSLKLVGTGLMYDGKRSRLRQTEIDNDIVRIIAQFPNKYNPRSSSLVMYMSPGRSGNGRCEYGMTPPVIDMEKIYTNTAGILVQQADMRRMRQRSPNLGLARGKVLKWLHANSMCDSWERAIVELWKKVIEKAISFDWGVDIVNEVMEA